MYISEKNKMYISVTGLKPKGILGYVRFWTLAIPAFREAQAAKGNVYAAVKRINGYQCTITAWEDKDMMSAFIRNGTHLKAMKLFHTIATGKTFGMETDQIPDWEKAFSLLQAKGIEY